MDVRFNPGQVLPPPDCGLDVDRISSFAANGTAVDYAGSGVGFLWEIARDGTELGIWG